MMTFFPFKIKCEIYFCLKEWGSVQSHNAMILGVELNSETGDEDDPEIMVIFLIGIMFLRKRSNVPLPDIFGMIYR